VTAITRSSSSGKKMDLSLRQRNDKGLVPKAICGPTAPPPVPASSALAARRASNPVLLRSAVPRPPHTNQRTARAPPGVFQSTRRRSDGVAADSPGFEAVLELLDAPGQTR